VQGFSSPGAAKARFAWIWWCRGGEKASRCTSFRVSASDAVTAGYMGILNALEWALSMPLRLEGAGVESSQFLRGAVLARALGGDSLSASCPRAYLLELGASDPGLGSSWGAVCGLNGVNAVADVVAELGNNRIYSALAWRRDCGVCRCVRA
jgi:hypothetical protein